MKIKPFKLERYFAEHEFTASHLLSCSDCEPLSLQELLSMADEDSLQLWNDLVLSYTHSKGHPLLREEISKLYTSIRSKDMCVLTPEEGIFIAMNVLLKEGDHIISTFPAYQSLIEIAKSINCEVSKWLPTDGEFDIKDLFANVRKDTKLIIINFPHNPTGATISKESLYQIVDFAKARNITIFSDEMYRYLEYDESDRLPSVSDIYDKAISLSGMSKSFGLAGARIGWLTSKNRNVIEDIIRFKDYTTICPSAPSEILSIIALRNKEKIWGRNQKLLESNLKLLLAFFQKHDKTFIWTVPRAASIIFPALNIDKSIDDFCADLLKKKGVLLLSASVFNYSHQNVRIGFGRKNFPEALQKLDEYLEENYSVS